MHAISATLGRSGRGYETVEWPFCSMKLTLRDISYTCGTWSPRCRRTMVWRVLVMPCDVVEAVVTNNNNAFNYSSVHMWYVLFYVHKHNTQTHKPLTACTTFANTWNTVFTMRCIIVMSSVNEL